MSNSKKIEKRFFQTDLEVDRETEKSQLWGYAAVFGKSTDLVLFTEEIKPGAFKSSIDRDDDIRALIDHDASVEKVIGRRSAKSLKILEDRIGLRVEIDLPDTTVASDLLKQIENGNIDGMSFAGVVTSDKWDYSGEIPHRTIYSIDLIEVSVVTFPAYTDTSIAQRKLNAELREIRSKSDQTREAKTKPFILTAENRSALQSIGLSPDAIKRFVKSKVLNPVDGVSITQKGFDNLIEGRRRHIKFSESHGQFPFYYQDPRSHEWIGVNAERASKLGNVELRDSPPVRPDITNEYGNFSIMDKTQNKFSLGKMVRCLAEKKNIDGFEREMIDEGQQEARESKLPSQGLMISSKAFMDRAEYRDLSATGGTDGDKGGMLIASEKSALLPVLFDRLFAVNAGATVYDQLTGNLDIPRLVDDSEPGHKAENAAADEIDPTTAELKLTPKRLPVVIEVSNQLLFQSSEKALDQELKLHLVQKLQVVMQRMMINGSGASNQPTGILQTNGIGAVSLGTDGGAPTYASLVNLIRGVSVDNALDNSSAFAINPKVAAELKQIQKVASTDSMTLIDDRAPGMLAGYRFYESNSVPSDLTKGSGTDLSAIIFGTWRDLVLAQWSGIEILVNPFSKDDQGLTRINAAIYYDCGVRRPASFAAITDCITS